MKKSTSHQKSAAKPSPASAAPAAPEPPIRCSYASLVDPTTLQPTPNNPNHHPPEQLALYAKVIRHRGWRRPILISRQSGRIVAGHGAWLTALQEKWPLVPIDTQDFATPDDETAHLLADNSLPQLAEMDDATLQQVLASLPQDFDKELAGILERLDPELPPEPALKADKRVRCPKCKHRFIPEKP